MLVSGFYTIQKTKAIAGSISVHILLNPKHEVYKGHFPGHPVVPGVIQLQIIKEILAENLGRQLFLHKVNSAKYLKIISPEKTPQLQLNIDYQKSDENTYKVNANISSNECVFSKMKMRFVASLTKPEVAK